MAEVLEGNQLESTTVAINRTSTTVKGGRRLSFAALVVVGNRDGSVGIGYGKGRGVPVGIEKAQKDARKNMVPIKRLGGTVPHEVQGKYCASSVRLIPAAPGTGVIAGGTVRAVLEMAGIRDCLTKAYGSTNKINLCRAVVAALQQLQTREEIAALRGVTIEKSTVDEVLEANKRYMTEGDSDGNTKKAKGPTNVRDEEAKKSRGRGRGGPGGGRGGSGGGRGGASAPAAAPAAAATPAAEASAPATEAPAAESKPEGDAPKSE
ncbi:MAG: 30S ribosomal protein S5 [Planctomycetota bacterium]